MDVLAIKTIPFLIYLNDKNKKVNYSPHVKSTFEQHDGGIIIQYLPDENDGGFSINNLNVYNESGECIKVADEKEYLTVFELELTASNKIKPIDIPEYLDCHYMASKNKVKMLRIVKIIGQSKLLEKYPSKSLFIREWISKIEKDFNAIQSGINISMINSNFQFQMGNTESSQNITVTPNPNEEDPA